MSRTSPVIANLVLKTLDQKLASYGAKRGVIIRRYGDDITSSSTTDMPNLESDICKLVILCGFKVNRNKLAEFGTMYSTGVQEVVGIQVNEGFRIPLKKFDQYLDVLSTPIPTLMEITESKRQTILKRREGIMAYARRINPSQAALLVSEATRLHQPKS